MRLKYFLLLASCCAFVGQVSSQLTASNCDLVLRVKASLDITDAAIKRSVVRVQDWMPDIVSQWKNFDDVCNWKRPMHVEPCSANDIFRLFTNMMLLTAWDYKLQLDVYAKQIPDFVDQILPIRLLEKFRSANLQQIALIVQDVNIIDFIVTLAPVIKNPVAFILIYAFYYMVFVQRWFS